MNLILKATQFSALKHHDQKRKDGKTPYIIHPISVAMILSDIGGIDDEEILSAALLHDTIEDTDTTAGEIEIDSAAPAQDQRPPVPLTSGI